MPRFVIACPRGSKTGGPEALHQLASAISDESSDAFLWDPYYSDEAEHDDNYFAHYEARWTDLSPETGDVLVVPEVMGELVPRFYGQCQCVFWWLSVDNFFVANKYPIEVLLALFPKVVHVAQSHYAKEFLRSKGVESMMLTDYLNVEFDTNKSNNTYSIEMASRQFDVAINPAKGFERASRVMSVCRELNFLLLENMSREEVIRGLANSKIYLDLGNHPGTDRIPREAAVLGCVLVTNKRGSAGNQIDIAIDERLFKFSDEESDFEVSIKYALEEILGSLETSKSKQVDYVAWIRGAKTRFENEVFSFVSQVKQRNYSTSNIEKIIANCVDLAFRERDRLSVERDQLVVDRDRLSVERDQLVVDRDRLSVERDRLNVERDQLVVDRDRLNVERSQLVVDRDQLVVDRDRLSVERDQLAVELEAIKSSILWRCTYPAQVVAQFFKKSIKTLLIRVSRVFKSSQAKDE